MNSKYASEKDAAEALREKIEQAKTTNQTIAARIAICRCFDEGIQWIGQYLGSSQFNSVTGRRPMMTNWNPNSSEIVATVNRVSKLTQETTAATFPDKMEVEADPGDRDTGMEASLGAQVGEALCNWMIDWTSYVPSARTCNHRRVIDGTHVLGWGMKAQTRERKLRSGGTETVNDKVLTSFCTDSANFYLDPGCQELDLHQHEEVVWANVWTLDKLRREWGVEIDEKNCRTMGELMAMELHYNTLSQNRLYTQLPLFSKTKSVRVYQMHSKGPDGDFPTMLLGYDDPTKKETTFVNWDEQETPFGFHGLPFTMFHGHRRPDSMWSRSDVAMLKDDQERLNLVATLFKRMLKNNAGLQWLASKGAVVGKDEDNWKDQFNNAVGGVIMYEAGNKDRPVAEPRLVQYPPPQQGMQEIIRGYDQDMRGQVHRPDITVGATKTHVPDRTYQSALQSADQVLGNRTSEDLDRHENHLTVGLGTIIKLVNEGNPSVLACLHRAGFDETDYQAIAREDPRYLSYTIRVRESSIKYQSPSQKEQRMWNAVQNQAIDPKKLRRGLAALDIAVDEDDKAMYENARRAAVEVLMGREWQGELLGDFSDMFTIAFQRAMFDRRAKKDPETYARLQRAIENQTKFDLAQQKMTAQAQNPQPPQPQEAPQDQGQEDQQEGPSEADLGSLLNAIQQGSTAQAA